MNPGPSASCCTPPRLDIVPVMDLMGGRVVRARRGERWRYRPLRSALCQDSRPLAVAEALMGLYPFARLYLADLDAIAGRGDNQPAIDRIRRRYPRLELWTDCGIHDETALRRLYARRTQIPVLGSETLRSPAVLRLAVPSARTAVLSLDFRGPRFLGPRALLTAPGLWPQRVILMTLERVGAASGPDLDRLRSLSRHTGPRAWYAAGGVRGPQDLERLHAMGVAGALVASTLHDGRLDAGLLARYGSGTGGTAVLVPPSP